MRDRGEQIQVLDINSESRTQNAGHEHGHRSPSWLVLLIGVIAAASVWMAVSLHSIQDAQSQQACMEDAAGAFERLDEVLMRTETQRPPTERLRERAASLAETLRGCGASASADAILLQLEEGNP